MSPKCAVTAKSECMRLAQWVSIWYAGYSPITTYQGASLCEYNLTGYASRRARSDAHYAAPLPYGYLLRCHVLCCVQSPHSDGDCPRVVLLALQCLPYCPSLRAGKLGFTVDTAGRLAAPVRTTVLIPGSSGHWAPWLKAMPRAYGCAARAGVVPRWRSTQRKHGLEVSRGPCALLHEMGWVGNGRSWWPKDDDPQRVERLARIGGMLRSCQADERLVFADELDIHSVAQSRCRVDAQGEPGGNHDARGKMRNTISLAHSISPLAKSCMPRSPEKTAPYFVTC